MPNDKDHYEKKLEDYDDVFADIINALVFQGKHVVREEALETGMTRSSYRVEGKFEEQERDAKKYWKDGKVRIAILGLENQTEEDEEVIFRCFGYDGAEYRDQIRARAEARRQNARIRKETPPDKDPALVPMPAFHPVITLVLYFGDRHWNGSLSLKDHVHIPAGLEDYVQDYKLNLFEIAYLTDEQVALFQSDFRFVAEYFTQRRKWREGILPELRYPVEKIRHVEAMMELLNALTRSSGFSAVPEVHVAERRENTMDFIEWLFTQQEEERMARRKALWEAEAKPQWEAEAKPQWEAEAKPRWEAEARSKFKAEGEEEFSRLVQILLQEGDYSALKKASSDPAYRRELYDKYEVLV